jgi:hypothetical protein
MLAAGASRVHDQLVQPALRRFFGFPMHWTIPTPMAAPAATIPAVQPPPPTGDALIGAIIGRR